LWWGGSTAATRINCCCSLRDHIDWHLTHFPRARFVAVEAGVCCCSFAGCFGCQLPGIVRADAVEARLEL
jgi:hypothetical protein